MTPQWRWVAVVVTATLALFALPGAAGMATASNAAAWSAHAPYLSPVSPMRVETLAHLPAQPWLPGHRGVDLQAFPGQTVSASAPGAVSFVGLVVDRPVLTIRHDDGALSTVEPVDSELTVGTRVAAGESIGVVSDVSGHCAPAVCVHWGVRVAGDYIDPLDVLAGYGRVVLLPRSAASRLGSKRDRTLNESSRA